MIRQCQGNPRQAVLVAAIIASLGACAERADPATQLAGPRVPLGDPSGAAAVTSGTIAATWYNEPGGVSVAVDATDHVFTARWDYNPAGDIYVAKRTADGALLWEVRYDNTDNTRHEVATWVGSDRAGNVLVSGTIRSGYSTPVNANSLLMKFAPNGSLLWRRVYGANFDGSSTRKLLVDAADNIYVLGLGVSPNGMRTTVRKFAPDGSTLWSWFDPAGIGAPLNFKFTPDGALVISARALVGSINGYAKVGSSGNTVWTLPGITSLTAGDIAGGAFGNSYLVNGNYATGNGSLVRKVGPAATTIWERSHPMAALRVDVGADNAPVDSGFPSAGSFGAAFAKLDPAGNVLWTNLDADGSGVSLLAHAYMTLDAAGDAYLAAGTMSQMGVTKVVGATGASAWTAIVPYGYANQLALGQAGRVFVTGGTTARIDQQVTAPNTPPTVTIARVVPGPIPVNGTFHVNATLADPDIGDGPWTYRVKWGNGPTTGTWSAPGTYLISRVYPKAGIYYVSVIVTDARGAADTSDVLRIAVR